MNILQFIFLSLLTILNNYAQTTIILSQENMRFVSYLCMYSRSVYFLVLAIVASESLMYSKYPWFFIVGNRNYCENIENVF